MFKEVRSIKRRRNGVLDYFWKLIVSPTAQFATRAGFADTTPLLEKERDSVNSALQVYIPDPFLSHWPGSRSTLAADNNPMNATQIHFPQVFEERLDGKKSDSRFRSP